MFFLFFGEYTKYTLVGRGRPSKVTLRQEDAEHGQVLFEPWHSLLILARAHRHAACPACKP